MTLNKDDWAWLTTVSEGAIAMPAARKAEFSDVEQLSIEHDRKMAEQASKERALKDSMIAAAVGRLGKFKEELRDASKMDVVVKGKITNSTLSTRAEKVEKGVDTFGDAGRMLNVDNKSMKTEALRPQTPAEAANSVAAPQQSRSQVGATVDLMGKILAESDALAAVKTDRYVLDAKTKGITTKREALFTAEEITAELWTPLVRERVIPDNFVPDRFSEVQQMITGSNDPYSKECREKGKNIGLNLSTFFKGGVDMLSAGAQAVLAGLGPVSSASATGSLVGNVNQIGPMGNTASSETPLDSNQLAIGTQVTIGVALLLDTGADALNNLDNARRSGSVKFADFSAAMNGFAGVVGRALAAGTGNDEVGGFVTAAISAELGAFEFGKYVIDTGKQAISDRRLDWKALTSDMGAAMARALGKVASGTLAAASDETQGNPSLALSDAADGAQRLFEDAALLMEKQALGLARDGKWKDLAGLIAKIGVQTMETLPGDLTFNAAYNDGSSLSAQGKAAKQLGTITGGIDQIAGVTDKVTGLAIDALAERQREAWAATGQAMPSLQTKHGQLAAEVDDDLKKKKKAAEKKTEAEELDRLAAEKEEERKAYEQSLMRLGSDSSLDAKAIDALIAQIEKDRAIWAAINAIVAGGAAVASNFMPGLKAAGEAAKLISNVKAAAERWIALTKWRWAVKDARNAVSPYATALKNMVSNQAGQGAQYSVQAAINACRILAEAGQFSPYAPAFKIADAGLAMIGSTEQLIYNGVKQAALIRAWRTTKKALANPQDRRLNLAAREQNPTLAKYTLAYGAVVANDEIAKRALSRINVDAETLIGASVGDVKKYLQTLYKDDNVVLGRLALKPTKAKVPEAALTPEAWLVSIKLWREKDGLTENPPASLPGLLDLVSKAAKIAPEEMAADQAELTKRALLSANKQFVQFASALADSAPAIAERVEEYADLALATCDNLCLMQSPEMRAA